MSWVNSRLIANWLKNFFLPCSTCNLTRYLFYIYILQSFDIFWQQGGSLPVDNMSRQRFRLRCEPGVNRALKTIVQLKWVWVNTLLTLVESIIYKYCAGSSRVHKLHLSCRQMNLFFMFVYHDPNWSRAHGDTAVSCFQTTKTWRSVVENILAGAPFAKAITSKWFVLLPRGARRTN